MLIRALIFMERASSYFLGKGWGTGTVAKEFKAAVSLLDGRAASICIDIGGNKGMYSEHILNKFPNCNIVIFEPSGTNADILREKFSNASNVSVQQCAVSNVVGDAILYSDHDGSGLASLTRRRLDHFGIEFERVEKVSSIRFEDYWRESLGCKNIDICKIDIEGHELDALMGFGEAIKHISVIQFEFGGCNIDTRTFFQDFWYFFQDNGFDIYRISPLGIIHLSRYREQDEFFSTTNFIAKRRR